MSIMEHILKTRGQLIKLRPHSLVDDFFHRGQCLKLSTRTSLIPSACFTNKLRENLLYMSGDLLVDFDGVGRDGGDRYSVCLDPAVKLGVNRWQMMKKEHDDGDLKQLTERLSGGYLDRKLLFPVPSTTALRFLRR